MHQPDLILMDVNMLKWMAPPRRKQSWPDILKSKVALGLYRNPARPSTNDAGRAVPGYVLKDAGPGELQRALLSALRSESPVPRR